MSTEKCSRCGAVIADMEPACLLDGQEVVCRNCHDAARPVCPHCGKDLKEKLPDAGGKCPSCDKRFWVDAEQWLFPSMIITPAQRDVVRKMRYEAGDLRDSGVGPGDWKAAELCAQREGKDARAVIRALWVEAIRRSGRAGLPDLGTIAHESLALAAEAFRMFKQTAKVIGNHGATLADVLLILTDNPAVETVDDLACAIWERALRQAEGNPQKASQICFELAIFRARRGREFDAALREGNRYKLLEYRQHDTVNRVRIVTGKDACRACRKLKNRVLPIMDAIERMPLPCEGCTTRYDKEEYPDMKGWCQCSYEAVFDDE